MNPEELIAHCERLGVHLSPGAEGKLDVVAPHGRITPELRAALREAKPAVLAALRARPAPEGWRLVYSESLRDIVLLILEPESAVPPELRERYVAYSPEEAALLEGSDDPLLLAVHAVKRVFGGEVVDRRGGRP